MVGLLQTKRVHIYSASSSSLCIIKKNTNQRLFKKKILAVTIDEIAKGIRASLVGLLQTKRVHNATILKRKNQRVFV